MPRYFKLEPNFFGETFHVGASLVLSGEYSVALMGDAPLTAQQRAFLESFALGRVFTGEMGGKTVALKKSTTEVLAPRFREDAAGTALEIRESFLAELPDDVSRIHEWLDTVFGIQSPEARRRPRAVIRIRQTAGESATRNSTRDLLKQIRTVLNEVGINEFILVGDPPMGQEKGLAPSRIYDLTNFHQSDTFLDVFAGQSFKGQLYVLDLLYRRYNARITLGMMSGALDGPALMGVPTIFFQDESGGTRMKTLAEALPTMQRVEYESRRGGAGAFTKLSDAALAALRNAVGNIRETEGW